MSGAWSVQGHEQGHWGTQAVPVSTARWGRPGVSHPRLETCWLLPHRSVSDSSGFEGRAKFASRRREHFRAERPDRAVLLPANVGLPLSLLSSTHRVGRGEEGEVYD